MFKKPPHTPQSPEGEATCAAPFREEKGVRWQDFAN